MQLKINFKNRLLNVSSFKYWFAFTIFSGLGLITIHLYTFVPELLSEEYLRKYSYEHNFQYFILYFYFTFQSNLIGFITGILVLLNVFDKNNVHFQRIKGISFVNLFLTMILFWISIFPTSLIYDYSIFGIFNTIILHFISPMLIIIAYIVDLRKSKFLNKLSYREDLLIYLIFPIIWTNLTFFEYFVLGNSRPEAAIYSVLNFSYQTERQTLLTIFVCLGIYFTTSLFIIMLNKKYCQTSNYS